METITHLFLFCVFLFPIFQSANSTESNLLKYYEEFVNDLVSNRLSGMIN